MKRLCLSVLSMTICLAAISASPVEATIYFEVKKTCPIGNETFTASEVGSNSTFGQRPDGKPYSPLPVVPYPECPSNGFPLFEQEFSQDALAILEPIVRGADFQASRRSETQHYRVWILRKALEAKPGALAIDLMVAGWETDRNLERKARYQNEFVTAVTKIERSGNEEEWFWLNLRAANALRELGRFEEAVDRLNLLASQIDLLKGKQAHDSLPPFIASLRQLTQERNQASEPAGAVPDQAGAFRCVIDQASLSPSEVTVCKSRSMAMTIADYEFSDGGRIIKGADAIRAIRTQSLSLSEPD